jgi:hypothetical protein
MKTYTVIERRKICQTQILKHWGYPSLPLCLQESRLKFFREQTPEVCLEAVRQNGNALAYVKEQTLEICLAAVRTFREDVYALRFVREQTPEICLAPLGCSYEHSFHKRYIILLKEVL